MTKPVVILGVFVADTAYRAPRPPKMGETILGDSFALGPGGKGSNQAVAAAKAGAEVHFISRLGQDPFADMALKTWGQAGVIPAVTHQRPGRHGCQRAAVRQARRRRRTGGVQRDAAAYRRLCEGRLRAGTDCQ